ncbi:MULTISPECIES: TetR/AcrR family transcriptional regulator [unclassified Rathayibacter]|uniref:TetR/AcrR family transcriptional regulator n=1 Tax=unclassified Rathayibacter TaxID=2609250 RepID=UPI001049D796|nr:MULTISPECIES: TetR/AcrR family transcriptional regulator [unclassified Rathayibacter]TCL79383.1 TetR family transcriptional regulator [Rathayibacter sp. PhB192]TCM25349.1 TetR family transcriptional regulator [Rathayibacter sp. PhB179]
MTATAPSPGTRARLVFAARAELVEQGLAGVSLRGIARRAEVSHAAPKYFFGNRAGLLTAVAVEGFAELAARLRAAKEAGGPLLGRLGRVYVRFGLENPALFELMFSPSELHPEDSALRDAQAASITLLASATESVDAAEPAPEGTPPPMALVSWAFAHGLVALVREGALQSAAGGRDAAALTDDLIDFFDRAVR